MVLYKNRINGLARGIMSQLAKRPEEDENILIKDCAWCGQPFYQGRDNHRFCCVEHGRQFHIAERRAALALYRAIQVQRTGVFGTPVEEQKDGPENSRLAG